jgi:polar amino acid transport system substrate-binding protein
MKFSKKPFVLFLTISFFVLILISNHNVVNPAPADSLSEILQRGYIIVGSSPDYPPFEFINQSTGVFEGFDVMIGHQIAIDLEVGLQFKNVSWSTIIPDLQSNQYDVIIGAMTITPQRELEVDFSRWYYKFELAGLAPLGNPLNLNSVLDLNQSDLQIGIEENSASEGYIQNLIATINTYSDIASAIADLKLGTLDVVIDYRQVLEDDAQQSGLTEVVFGFSPEDFGIAVRNGESALLSRINQTISDLLGSNLTNPEPTSLYNAIYYNWFGVSYLPYYKGNVTSRIIPVTPFYNESGNLVTIPIPTVTTTVSTTVSTTIPTTITENQTVIISTTEIQTNIKTETKIEISQQTITTTNVSAFYFLIPITGTAIFWKIKKRRK